MYYSNDVTPTRQVVTFRIDPDLQEGMDELKDRDGIPYSEQIRRALREWLVEKAVVKAAPRRVSPRRRA